VRRRSSNCVRVARPGTAESGFTLLEIMMVALIIGILASFAVLSIGSRSIEDRLQLEARRLNQLLVYAADEAVQQGVEIGFLQVPEGYAFLALGPDGLWAPVEGDGPLRQRELAPPFYLELHVEGRPVAPALEGTEDLAPHVVLLSSGEITPFSLILRAGGLAGHYQLEGDALGRFTLDRKDGGS
jgi:general secretion pathway protein H